MTTSKVPTFSASQLSTMRAEYAKLNTVPAAYLPRFHALFARCEDLALRQLAAAKIKFVSKLAVNACVRRNVALA